VSKQNEQIRTSSLLAEELLKNITKAVKEVASFFESKAKEASTLHGRI
jgi:hypothetical protein